METVKYEVEVEVYCECDTCGATLDTTLVTDRYGNNVIRVGICQKCKSEAYAAGQQSMHE